MASKAEMPFKFQRMANKVYATWCEKKQSFPRDMFKDLEHDKAKKKWVDSIANQWETFDKMLVKDVQHFIKQYRLHVQEMEDSLVVEASLHHA